MGRKAGLSGVVPVSEEVRFRIGGVPEGTREDGQSGPGRGHLTWWVHGSGVGREGQGGRWHDLSVRRGNREATSRRLLTGARGGWRVTGEWLA
jgi:hypothetical protein